MIRYRLYVCDHWAEILPGWHHRKCPACWLRAFLARHPECAPYVRLPEVVETATGSQT